MILDEPGRLTRSEGVPAWSRTQPAGTRLFVCSRGWWYVALLAENEEAAREAAERAWIADDQGEDDARPWCIEEAIGGVVVLGWM